MTQPLLHPSNFQQQLDYLYNLDGRGIKPGLRRILEFLDRIGNPQSTLTTIHVAGTNGKGSTCAMLAAILQAAGLQVGLYTSPHLVRFNERIRINQEKISDGEIVTFLEKYRSLIDELDTTFFETTTAMALAYFANRAVDVAVLETGLGGRYDATNVTTPIMSVITPIGKDHEEFLGKTLASIALEKAGIIKPGVPVVCAGQKPHIRQILTREAAKKEAPFFYAPEIGHIKVTARYLDRQILRIDSDKYLLDRLEFPFLGDHQIGNLMTVLAAVNNLTVFPVSGAAVASGLSTVRWPGRLELLSREPLIYYDVGHNLHGIRQIVLTLKRSFPAEKFNLLIALGAPKKVGHLGKVLRSIAGAVWVSEIPGKKSIPATALASALKRDLPQVPVTADADFSRLLRRLMGSLRASDRLIILGSHYFSSVIYDFFKINV